MTDHTQAREALERFDLASATGSPFGPIAHLIPAKDFTAILALVASLDAEIAELKARVAWQPMETVPLNSEVLIYDSVERYITISEHLFEGEIFCKCFTHWMPIPEPPEGA